MKVVIGIGNPGKEYENTRHNIGFMILDSLAEKLKLEFKKSSKLKYTAADELVLIKPQTYVNLTGSIVPALYTKYDITNQDILVVCDDFNLPFGSIRIRKSGSSGGHHGLESIIEQIGTDFARMRIGISLAEGIDPKDYVLDRFTKKEREILKETIERGVGAVLCWKADGIEKSMNKFNSRSKQIGTE